MQTFQIIRGAAVGLACLGMIAPQSAFSASPVAAPVVAKATIADVALSAGVLNGRVVDTQGELQAGTVVKLNQNGQTVASVVTDQQGRFAVNELKNGVYQIVTGENSAMVRIWESQVAPPAAKSDLLIVNGGPIARGQLLGGFSTTTLIVTTVVVGTAVGVGVAVSQNDDDDNIIVSP